MRRYLAWMAISAVLLLVASIAHCELFYAPAEAASPPVPAATITDVARLQWALRVGDDHQACEIARRLFAIEKEEQ